MLCSESVKIELAKLRQAMVSLYRREQSEEAPSIESRMANCRGYLRWNASIATNPKVIWTTKKPKRNSITTGLHAWYEAIFYEMACVIQECYRVLDKSGVMFMVNDNVRYAGVAISVDTILSSVAQDIGFRVEKNPCSASR